MAHADVAGGEVDENIRNEEGAHPPALPRVDQLSGFDYVGQMAHAGPDRDARAQPLGVRRRPPAGVAQGLLSSCGGVAAGERQRRGAALSIATLDATRHDADGTNTVLREARGQVSAAEREGLEGLMRVHPSHGRSRLQERRQ